jgi:hypothetical protein
LLDDVHAQHPLQTDRRTAPTFTLGIERFQLRQQLGPWRHRFDVGKKTVTPRHLLLRRIFQGRLNNQVQHLVKVLRWETNTNN